MPGPQRGGSAPKPFVPKVKLAPSQVVDMRVTPDQKQDATREANRIKKQVGPPSMGRPRNPNPYITKPPKTEDRWRGRSRER